ncbi:MULTISPECIES: uroporphyrinogen-III synthase [unclassified Polynucleobacter]|jgi:uroporphyrinogen-III synthase|uniref:uroporphyrinogen-III synthase n=1 Tax=unclassified Polynucleobacter TaxID=2640945 RepID=UPI00092CA4FD|nr:MULTISPECIES: uroporphyrinogen-III synthase [unclassified Polynucleobacter]MBU3563269.1 uroporphyrinogen-III synthase [Polynucleobacter sp. Tro8-14-1]MBU3642153.1 uroporphyrinogen-III synthase [Polynucleobacter sp. Fuers-14]OJI04272.1 uroporphyrinogen III synthase [Polynucleobacter sp. MWH-Adler-W8]
MSTKTIIVTRPAGQARQLIEVLTRAIEASGVGKRSLPEILSLPLLTIVPKSDGHLADHIASTLSDADLAIFVSPNAIESVMRLLERDWQDFSKKIIPIGVMGGSSHLALRNHGVGSEDNPTPIIIPGNNENWDSEGLWKELQSLKWNWQGKKVVIFKGEGGRDWLADTLKKAGATVEAISTYTRVPLDIDNPAWQLVREMDLSKSLWLLTSSEAVRYLGEVMKDQFTQNLNVASALCPHHNIADAAEMIGFGEVFTSEPGDEALIKSTLAWLTI